MVRKLWFISACISIVCVVVFAGASRISAQTNQSFQYVIPHFSASAGSQFVLSNLSSVTVNPEVTLRDSNAGQFADTFITVGAGTQQRLTAASFGLSTFEGTVVVTSSARLSVIATIAAGNAFETLRASETVLDSKIPGSGATQLIIPFSQGTTGQTKLTIFNPNNTQTTVVIAPVQSDGSLTGNVQATIPPFGTVKQDVSALFPQTTSILRDTSYLLIRVPTSIFGSGRGVFAQGEMVNFTDAAEGISVPRADFSAVNGVPIGDAVSSGRIPFFTEGGNYATELQFINATAASAAITLSANGIDGNAVPGTSPATITVPPNGSVRRNVQHIFSFNGAAVQGAISFNSTAKVIATEAVAGVNGTSFALMPVGAQQDTDFAFSVHTSTPQFFTGLTFLNPDSSTAANLVLRYVSDDGTPVSSTALSLDASAGMVEATRVLGDLMPEAQNAGFLHVHSDIPIFAAALEGAADNSVLADLPSVHPQADYQAPNPTTFLVSGSVRQVSSAYPNGLGIPGVGVQLSGPIGSGTATSAVNVSATTNQYGAFTLPQLQQPPVGDYTLSATAAGYALSPPKTIHIAADANGNTSGSSRGNDFTAALQQPGICEVQPAGILAGSSSTTTLVVIGSPLAPNAQILFNGKALPTTSITATTLTSGCLATLGAGASQAVPALQATLDPTLLAQPGTAQVALQINGPAGSAQSQSYSLGIGGSAPVLTGFGPIPVPLIAGCCPSGTTNPGLTTIITGTGFAPTTSTPSGTVGVNVLIGVSANGVITTLKTLKPDNGAVVFLSPTSIQVTIPPDVLAVGRVLKVSVINPGPTIGPSNSLDLPVLNPIPVVTQIQPNTANVELEPNAPPIQLTVNGFGFQPGAAISVGGVNVPLDPTQPQTSNSLVGFIPQSALQVGGVFPVTIVNPAPSVGSSAAVPFFLQNLPPVLSTVEPAPLASDKPLTFDSSRPSETYPATIIARGANFSPKSIFQLINGCAPITITPTSAIVPVFQRQQFTAYLNGIAATSNQVTWAIASSGGGSSGSSSGPIGQIDRNGLYTAPVVVPNPAVITVTVTSNADPTLFAVATVTVTSPSLTAGAEVGAGAVGTAVVSSHEAVLTVTISCAGQYVIYAENPQPGGGTSQRVSFTVAPYTPQSQPVISFITPPVVPVAAPNTADLLLTVTGANFEAGAVVNFGSTVLFPSSISSDGTTITVNVPWYLLTVRGSIPIVVTNPDATGSSDRILFGVN